MDILKPERAALIDAFLPVHIDACKPIPGDFMHSPYPERFVLPIKKPWGKWWIGACFNWDDKPRNFDYPIPEGVKKPVVVDFWKKKLLPVKGGKLKLRVEPHGVRLFSIRSRPQKPAHVGLIRHITQGAVEVTRYVSRKNSLEIEIAKSRAPVTAFIYTAGRKVTNAGLPPSSKKSMAKRILKIVMPKGGPHTLRLEFRR
jgi:hypothetical protein